MSLFGIGGSQSKSSSSTDSTTQAAYGSSGSGATQNFNLSKNTGPVNIATSDYGAIDKAFEFSNATLTAAGAQTSQAISATQALASSAIDKTLSLANKNQTSESAQLQQTLLYAGLGVAVLFAIVKVFGK